MNYNIILIRHGQSTYNLENRFTGWEDVSLTDKGTNEAIECASIIKDIKIDLCYTSNLKRAQNTLTLILQKLKINPKVIKNIALNERDYGDLIGKNKAETAKIYGQEQVEKWRRSYNIPPPNGESLKMTYDRVIPYLQNTILNINNLESIKNILISAHGNSIRAIVMYLLKLTPELILKTEIGWCEPWVLSFKDNKLTNIKILSRSSDKTMSFLPYKFENSK